MSKGRDSIADRLGMPPEQPAEATPSALAAKLTLEEALAEIARSQVKSAQSQADLTKALAMLLGDSERLAKTQREEIEKVERVRRQVEKTNQQVTQEIADQRWKAASKRYRSQMLVERSVPTMKDPSRRVKSHVPDMAFPEVDINADSVEEATERYRIAANITGYDGSTHRIVCVPLGEVPGTEAEPELQMQRA